MGPRKRGVCGLAWTVLMPAFVSRFSPSRIAGANFQGLRARVDGQEGRGRIGASNRERRVETRDRDEDFLERIRGGGEREDLLVRNQLGELVRSRLQERVSGQRGGAGTSGEDEDDGVQRAETGSRTRTLPGVGTTRTRADDEIDRPGRLGTDPANPAIQSQLDRFASLRSAARGSSTQSRQDASAAATLTGLLGLQAQRPSGLDQALDAQTRGAADRTGPARGGTTTGSDERGGGGVETEPTAEEISRANTTPEIRENLQSEVRGVERGLRRDAAEQARVNTRNTAVAAGEAAEARRGRAVSSNRGEIQALQSGKRKLEAGIRETQREIRNLENSNRRLQSGANRATTRAAAALGSNVNLVT